MGGGLIRIGKSKAKVYVADATKKSIDKEVSRLVTETYEKTKEMLEDKKDKLEKVTKYLLEKEVIEGKELRQLIAEG